MCWMCDHPGSTKEDYYAELRATISRHGWAVQFVESDRVPLAYTVGLTRRQLPELLVTGLAAQQSVRLLNRVAELVADGDSQIPGTQFALPRGPLLEVVRVQHPDAHMYAAIGIYRRKIRALQMVWADAAGRWPWDAAFNDGRGGQPVLGMRAVSRKRRYEPQDGDERRRQSHQHQE
jgi:hypothetical protein